MNKKDFTGAAADVFVSKMATQEEKPQAQPKTDATAAVPVRKKRAATGDKKHNGAGEERVTLFIDTQALEKLRTIAWSNKRKFKDVVAEAVQNYVTAYEKKHGEVTTR